MLDLDTNIIAKNEAYKKYFSDKDNEDDVTGTYGAEIGSKPIVNVGALINTTNTTNYDTGIDIVISINKNKLPISPISIADSTTLFQTTTLTTTLTNTITNILTVTPTETLGILKTEDANSKEILDYNKINNDRNDRIELIKKYFKSNLSPEESTRLEILTEELNKLNPPITSKHIDKLEKITKKAKELKKLDDIITKKYDL